MNEVVKLVSAKKSFPKDRDKIKLTFMHDHKAGARDESPLRKNVKTP